MTNLKINGIHLDIHGKVEGLSEEDFQMIAQDAKETCVISKILNIPITMFASLQRLGIP
jgi:lipoyl-dependent peroxiredoxin